MLKNVWIEQTKNGGKWIDRMGGRDGVGREEEIVSVCVCVPTPTYASKVFLFKFVLIRLPLFYCVCSVHMHSFSLFSYFRRLAFIQLVLYVVYTYMGACVNVFVSCEVLYVPDFGYVWWYEQEICGKKHTRKWERKSMKITSNEKRKIKEHNQKNFVFCAHWKKANRKRQRMRQRGGGAVVVEKIAYRKMVRWRHRQTESEWEQRTKIEYL